MSAFLTSKPLEKFQQLSAPPDDNSISTQTVAKSIARSRKLMLSLDSEGDGQADNGTHRPFFVTTPHQVSGSGTNSRTWFPSPSGSPSCYVTMGVHQNDLINNFSDFDDGSHGLNMKGVVILPLLVANIMRNYVQSTLDAQNALEEGTCSGSKSTVDVTKDANQKKNISTEIKVKWPNDLLKTIRAEENGNETEITTKVGGVLIQLVDDYFLIGIGINLFDSPKLLVEDGKDGVGGTNEENFRGREAGSIFPQMPHTSDAETLMTTAHDFVLGLVSAFEENIYNGAASSVTIDSTITDFEQNMYRGERDNTNTKIRTLEIRRDDGGSDGKHVGGQRVVVLKVQRDGGLLVVSEGGEEKPLYSDYLL